MDPHDSSDITGLLAQLEPRTEGEHRATLLRQLNFSVFGLTLFGLAFMLIPPFSEASYYAIVLLSLGVNALVYRLAGTKRVPLAAHIFVHWVNLGLILLFSANLFADDNSLRSAIMFSAVMAMCVMLAGMLLGPRAAFVFATIDSGVIVLAYSYFYLSFMPVAARVAFAEVSRSSVPVIVLLMITAVISWLYQRALAESERKVSLARQRILRDELLRRDLAIARELQQRLYPPPPLTDANLRIASRSEPARETSGDFYDFIDLGDGRLGIVVADVTGKSLAAALVMAMARGTLRSEATRHPGPAAVLRSANQTLCQDHSVRQMITAFYGVLDTRSLTLEISNAGHPFPVLRRDGRLEELEICGLPLGARPDAIYTERSFQLQPGDQLVLISDGLIEEHNDRRELFGFERMVEAISAADAADPEQAHEETSQAVARFRGATEQSDDITLVVIQVAVAIKLSQNTSQISRLTR
jgi:serine phosphatase RsbU (regulator of sigma subunit)